MSTTGYGLSRVKSFASFCISALTLVTVLVLSGCGGSSKPIGVSASASATTVDGNDSVTLTATVANDKTPGGVTWAVSGGGSLSNQTASSATYTAPPATGSSQSVTVTATSVADPTKSFPVGITVPAAPAVTTSSLTAATVGTAYSVTLAGSGGITPYKWSITSGTLPASLSLAQSTGVISGTPMAADAGTTNLTFKLTDSGTATALTATKALSLTINPAPAIVFTTTSLAAGTYNVAYNATVAATGGAGTLTYTLASGPLPTGLSLSASGAITGTPTAVGTFPITVKAADAFGDSATKSLSVAVSYPALTVTAATLPVGYVGSTYKSTTLAATGGSGTGYTWTATSPLPAGLSLSGAGVITGKPTGPTGPASFTVMVTDSASNTATATMSITIDAGITITTGTTLPTGYVGSNYSQQLAATGGTGAGTYTWTVTNAPAGLTLSTSGLLSGKPTTAGTPSFNVTVTDTANNTASATFSMTIGAAVTIGAITLPSGYQGAAYGGATFAATGGTGTGYTWSWTGNPAGLTLGASTGAISGTPTASGSFTVAVTVTDSVGNTGTASFPLTIEAELAITTANPLKAGTVGVAYTLQLAATGGTGSYTWSTNGPGTTSLASVGLTLSAGGLVAGASPTQGTATFTATVTDTATHTASGTFTISVTNALAITTPSLPAAYTNTAYSQTLAAAGGSGSGYTFSTTGTNNLATFNLSLSAGGVLSGTPTTTGTATFTAKVTDSASNTATASYSIPVYNPLTLPAPNPSTLGPATINVAYSGTIVATGGSGTGYVWTVTGLSDNLNYSSSGATLTISGTPSTAETITFTASVTDSLGNSSGTITYTIVASNALTLPAPNPATLGAATTAVSYTGTVVASGGSGTGYTFTVTGLPADGLNYAASGGTLTISGTPTSAQTVTFTASVKDSLNNTAGPYTYTIQVYNAVTLPTPSSTVPGPGTTGEAYSGSISASGGSGSYTWTITGFPSDGLSESTTGNTLNISGTPTSATTVTFTAKVADTKTGSVAGPVTYSVVVSNPPPLSLPTPNPSSLPSATVNQGYSGSVNATGGVGPYTWKINGTPVTGTPLGLSDGLSATSDGSSTLSVSGTPTTSGTVTLTGVTVTDSEGTPVTAGPDTYTINVNNAGGQVNGQIYLNNNCGGSSNVPTMTVSINTSPVQTTTTDSNGNYSFGSVPNGTWTITPSITGPSSVFYPATQGITVSGNTINNENFSAALGYTVSGTVSYSGSKTGQVYVWMNGSCGGNSTNGVSMTAPGAFTIHGVPPGTYTMQAGIDTLGFGAENDNDPNGSAAVTVTNANVTGQTVTLNDPSTVTITSAPSWQGISGISGGAFLFFKPVQDSNGVEMASSYTVQWSTSSTFASITGSHSFAATGSHGNPWVLSGLTNGQTYYFRAQGVAGSSTGPFSAISPGVLIGAPSTGNTVSGQVTFSGTATGPLYVGFYDQNTNSVYAAVVGSKASPPTSPASYTVKVPNGSNYLFFGIIDQNNDGLFSPGDISNTNSNNNNFSVTISGNLSNEDETLPSTNTQTSITTASQEQTDQYGMNSSYSINVQIGEGIKLPVDVQLTSGPNIIHPLDIGPCSGCGNQQFDYYANIGPVAPKVGDTYSFDVKYSDGTSETVTSAVTAVLSAFTTNMLPLGTSSTNTTPTFTWTDPANASNYVYQFSLWDSNGNTIWQVPGNNSNLNGLPSSVTSLTWGVDPNDSTNTPSVGSLTSGSTYYWQITVQDANGNQAQNQVWYQP